MIGVPVCLRCAIWGRLGTPTALAKCPNLRQQATTLLSNSTEKPTVLKIQPTNPARLPPTGNPHLILFTLALLVFAVASQVMIVAPILRRISEQLGPFVESEQKRALTTTETAYQKGYRRKQPENAGFRAFC